MAISQRDLYDDLDCYTGIFYKPLGDKGEDAFAYSFQNPCIHTQAVFDGCGGSGSWKYPEYKDATGAFVAAQTMAKAYLSWFHSITDSDVDDNERARRSFQAYARHVLLELKSSSSPMGIAGTMVKAFPCTANISIITKAGDSLLLTTMNVGDSRAYYLTPETGLVQLTEDDTRGHPDPLTSLWDGAPMSDMLNADRPFRIKSVQVQIPCPCVVINATDGVFGFVRSPMDFENLLLESILTEDSFSRFETKFKAAIQHITGDDSTCIFSFYGWKSYENLKKLLVPRYQIINDQIKIIDNVADECEQREKIVSIWKEYKETAIYRSKQE